MAETNAGGNITAYYVYGLGLISKITPAGKAYYYHYDGLGNTVAITDSSGNTVNKYSYDAFGKVLSQTETISNPFKYVGRFGVMDDGNGLLYMRARYYDPEVGRFINKDPIGLMGGMNMYAYVDNSPMSWIDPQGLYREAPSYGGAMREALLIDILEVAGAKGLGFYLDTLEYLMDLKSDQCWLSRIHATGVWLLKIPDVFIPGVGVLVDWWDRFTQDIGRFVFR